MHILCGNLELFCCQEVIPVLSHCLHVPTNNGASFWSRILYRHCLLLSEALHKSNTSYKCTAEKPP